MEFRVAFVARSEFGSFALRSLDSFAPFSIRASRAVFSEFVVRRSRFAFDPNDANVVRPRLLLDLET
jgi:hypothetical protein